jgi:hypothetical protein
MGHRSLAPAVDSGRDRRLGSATLLGTVSSCVDCVGLERCENDVSLDGKMKLLLLN